MKRIISIAAALSAALALTAAGSASAWYVGPDPRNQTIHGSDLDDELRGGGGHDVLIPHGGADLVRGGPGIDDVVLTPDGQRDVVNCGAGTHDFISWLNEKDPLDVIRPSCEYESVFIYG